MNFSELRPNGLKLILTSIKYSPPLPLAVIFKAPALGERKTSGKTGRGIVKTGGECSADESRAPKLTSVRIVSKNSSLRRGRNVNIMGDEQ